MLKINDARSGVRALEDNMAKRWSLEIQLKQPVWNTLFSYSLIVRYNIHPQGL